MWQGPKWKMKTLIHVRLLPCLYCTDCMQEYLLPPWALLVAGSVLPTKRIKARGCKSTGMRSCFLMGRQQSTAASRCTVKANAVISNKLQEFGEHCQSSLFIQMNTVLKQMAIKQEVCLFVGWINRLHWSQIALFSPQWNKSTYQEETSAIPCSEFSDQEIPSYNS